MAKEQRFLAFKKDSRKRDMAPVLKKKMNERKEGSGVWEEGGRRHGKGASK